jgi:Ser/Thr protein kinase RdoA (MazF antagonist)
MAQSPLSAVQRLLETCAQRCAGLGNPGWRHTDLVIGDFGPHNVLLNNYGHVAAVFDLEGAGHGDRVIDLVGLLYMVEPALLPSVRQHALQIASSAALTVCGVYWIVHRLY